LAAGIGEGHALHTRREVKLVLKLAAYVQTLLGRFDRDEEGQTMAEYAVILSVISALVIAALLLLGTNITTVIGRIADAIK
jgi:Flp pilus assembly pilin Flp